MEQNNNTENKKQLVGEVVESPMEKTAVVKVERRFPHPVYKKFISKTNVNPIVLSNKWSMYSYIL